MVFDAISNLAVNILTIKEKYAKKAVIFSSCRAETGATMIAVNIAIALSYTGQKTLLIDADLKKGSILENGLCDYLRGETGLKDVIRPSNLENLDFAPSGARIESPAMLMCSDKMKEFMELAKNSYEYVIINGPPVATAQDAAAMFMNTDGIVLVCSLNETTKRQMAVARNVISPYSDKYYGIVVNSMEEKRYIKLYSRRNMNPSSDRFYGIAAGPMAENPFNERSEQQSGSGNGNGNGNGSGNGSSSNNGSSNNGSSTSRSRSRSSSSSDIDSRSDSSNGSSNGSGNGSGSNSNSSSSSRNSSSNRRKTQS